MWCSFPPMIMSVHSFLMILTQSVRILKVQVRNIYGTTLWEHGTLSWSGHPLLVLCPTHNCFSRIKISIYTAIRVFYVFFTVISKINKKIFSLLNLFYTSFLCLFCNYLCKSILTVLYNIHLYIPCLSLYISVNIMPIIILVLYM